MTRMAGIETEPPRFGQGFSADIDGAPGGATVGPMKSAAALPLLLVLAFLPSCRLGKKSDGRAPEREPDLAVLGENRPTAQPGGYYKLKLGMNGFYYRIPSFVEAVPTKFLMGGHVVQLLDATVGDGWARVKSEDLTTGYVRMSNIKIVRPDKQPSPPRRDPDKELDMSMGLH